MARSITLAIQLGGVHAVVDASCAATVYAEVAASRFDTTMLLPTILAYNMLAFGLQWLIGIVADRRQAYGAAYVAGLWFLAVGVLTPSLMGIALIGIGNAAFHVGAGATVLRSSSGRATESGLFVGPGAIGVVAGIWLGLHSSEWRWPAVILLVLASVWVPRSPSCTVPTGPVEPSRSLAPLALAAMALLLLGSVAARSLMGGLLAECWSKNPAWAGFALGGAAAVGKSIGGLCCDRFGWRRMTGLALLLAAGLATGAPDRPELAIVAMLAVQFTMPATLAAMYAILPGRPGLAFGLPCLALLLGALPGLSGLVEAATLTPMIAPLALVSAIMLVAALTVLARHA